MERMKELIKLLNQYSYEYYTLGKPSVSDETYDHYYDELITLEETTGIRLSNSPTQKVGNTVLTLLKKVKHEYPLLSLGKTKKVSEVIKFANGKDIVQMDKLDGLTTDLTYNNGELQLGETRGNGEVGEDITHNVKTYINVPLTIPYKGKVHIIGESIITYDDFEIINSRITETDKKYKNPRNLVSGSVRQLDSSICAKRHVKFFGYIVEGVDFKTKVEQFNFIKEQGFDCVNYTLIKSSNIKIEVIENFLNIMRDQAKDRLIPIDGQVFMYNSILYGKSLGNTAHHPQHSLAFKFAEDVEETVLREVQWQVGRTGQVTPVAIFDTVELAGTEVSRASVHNLTILKDLQLGLGDTITVKKANEIIPQIVDNISKSNTLEIPTVCPVCGEPLKIKNDTDSEFLICDNDLCPAQSLKAISHYCSRKAMDIRGLSEKTLEMLMNKGYIKDIQDIYYLAKEDCSYKDELIHIKGFGKKSYDNLVKAINESKNCKLSSFIYALGIPNVGEQTAKDLVAFAKKDSPKETLKNLIFMDRQELLKMPNCGDVLASSVVDWFLEDENIDLINYLVTNELTFLEDIKPIVSDSEGANTPFAGKKIYCTGSFECGKKDELTAMVENAGGIFANGYAKSLDYLVVGKKKGSSKADKALNDGIKVLTEDEFLEMIK